jgi:pyrroloquinoline-quinone synthase
MERITQLDALVKQFDLNEHPFYTDWRAGTLPVAKLQHYAVDYGRFVGTIAEGWESLGEANYAAEERHHEELWGDFSESVGAQSGRTCPGADTLVAAAQNLFGEKATAVGALYAFEAQQPYTAQTKLEGLNEHYTLSDKGKEYFAVHAQDFNEVEDLKRHVAQMSEAEFAQTKNACAVLCAAMWGALDSIYYQCETVSA